MKKIQKQKWMCELCIYYPPSILSGKPCVYCNSIANNCFISKDEKNCSSCYYGYFVEKNDTYCCTLNGCQNYEKYKENDDESYIDNFIIVSQDKD